MDPKNNGHESETPEMPRLVMVHIVEDTLAFMLGLPPGVHVKTIVKSMNGPVFGLVLEGSDFDPIGSDGSVPVINPTVEKDEETGAVTWKWNIEREE